jgi:hypothetical protein
MPIIIAPSLNLTLSVNYNVFIVSVRKALDDMGRTLTLNADHQLILSFIYSVFQRSTTVDIELGIIITTGTLQNDSRQCSTSSNNADVSVQYTNET